MLTTSQLVALITAMLAKGTSSSNAEAMLMHAQTLLFEATIERSIAKGFNAYYEQREKYSRLGN